MWSWLKSLDRSNRLLLIFGTLFALVFLADHLSPKSAVSTASYDQPSNYAPSIADDRYVREAERDGYKGKDAQNVALAAQELCRGTGGRDC